MNDAWKALVVQYQEANASYEEAKASYLKFASSIQEIKARSQDAVARSRMAATKHTTSSWHDSKRHHPTHIAMIESVEYFVYRRQRLQLYIGLDLACRGEGERFGHIPACADERTPDSYAV